MVTVAQAHNFAKTGYKKLLFLAKPKLATRFLASYFPSKNPCKPTRNFPNANTFNHHFIQLKNYNVLVYFIRFQKRKPRYLIQNLITFENINLLII